MAYYKLDSSLILVYGLENMVDFLSSAIVLWRFFLPASSDAAEEARLLSREKRASIGISFVLAVLGLGTIFTSSEDFAAGKEELENLNALYYISFFSIVVFGTLAIFKFHYARKLKSSSLKKDAVCSALGTILATSLFFNTILALASDGSYWWLDPLIALICGVGSLVYGLHGVHKAYVRDGLPVCSCSWWLYGNKDMNSDLEMKQSSGPGNASPSTGPTSTRMARDEEVAIPHDDIDDIVLT